MSVEYKAIAGFGILVTRDVATKLGYSEEVPLDESINYLEEIFEDSHNVSVERAGSMFSGEIVGTYLFIKSNSFSCILDNGYGFVEELSNIGLNVGLQDIKWFREVLAY